MISTFKGEKDFRGQNGLDVFRYSIEEDKKNNRMIKCDEFLSETDDYYDGYGFDEYYLKDIYLYARKIIEQNKKFKELVDRCDELSDEKFFELYQEFYDWDTEKLKERHFLESYKNPKVHNVKTSDVASFQKREGRGRDFSWWAEWYNLMYEVVAEGDVSFEDRVYTKQELLKLYGKGKILVISKYAYGEELDAEEAYKTSEELSETTLPVSSIWKEVGCEWVDDSNSNSGKVIKHVGYVGKKHIREEMPKSRLMVDYGKFATEFERVMGEITARCMKYGDMTSEEAKEFIESESFFNEYM